MELLSCGKMLLDSAGEIQDEYRKKLSPSGQPGVGDRFYQSILQRIDKVERIDLPKDEAGNFVDLPSEIVGVGFHDGDRKFAAMAAREEVPVVNATDSDWAEHQVLLECHGVQIRFLCGCDPTKWRQ